jgi:hypothetical protein
MCVNDQARISASAASNAAKKLPNSMPPWPSICFSQKRTFKTQFSEFLNRCVRPEAVDDPPHGAGYLQNLK